MAAFKCGVPEDPVLTQTPLRFGRRCASGMRVFVVPFQTHVN
jgi:hypothetical protein